MRKRIVFCLVLLVAVSTACNVAPDKSSIVTTDIDNFWVAYDKIISTQDSAEQKRYFETLFWDKGTPGLYAMSQARNYTVAEYLHAINSYPAFWASVRENTYQAKTVSRELDQGIEGLRALYPELKPARIYFTIGALRSNGTTLDSMVLVGAELAFADKETVTDELPDYLSHLATYFETEPGQNIVFLNVHEYVHTQQPTTIGYNLLAQTVIEGVAEFVAEKALNVASPNPQINFGRANDARIKARFEGEMFSPLLSNWIWNSADNEFAMRDLGYYVGYKICEGFYDAAADKRQAIKEMIELDYNAEDDLISFVEKSAYFDQPLDTYRESFEKSRPVVNHIEPFDNGSQKVAINTTGLTIHFSEPMDPRFRNFEFGPLGEDHVVRFKNLIGFSDDGRSISFEIEPLSPAKKYQIVVGARFRNLEGISLVPYLIEFETAE